MRSGQQLPFPHAPQQGWGDSGATCRTQTGHPHPEVPDCLYRDSSGRSRGRAPRDGPGPPAPPGPTSFLLSAEELSSLDTNSLLLKLSLVLLAGDLLEDEDLAAPFLSAFPFGCFSCFFFFFFNLSLRVLDGRERRHITLGLAPQSQDTLHLPAAEAQAPPWLGKPRFSASPPSAQRTHRELSALLPALYSFMAFS